VFLLDSFVAVFIAFVVPFLSVPVLGVREEDVDVARIDACFCKRTPFRAARALI
jgi:hypothetical protein